jgi:hypothetical protein
MATIELSSGWVTSMMPRIFRLADGSPATAGATGVAGAGLLHSGFSYSGAFVGTIYLMKGVIPASATATATINARASDILVTFGSGTAGTAGDFVTSQVNVNPAVISTQYASASVAGTATWFWWVVPYTLGSGQRDQTIAPAHQIIGTVGITGSGADLEMVSTNIVVGEQYRVMNIRLQFPTSWVY